MRPSPSLNVRISSHSHALLRQLATEADEPMQAVLDKAIERYRRETFLKAANEDYAAVRRNPRAWKAALQERRTWDGTLADGLDRK